MPGRRRVLAGLKDVKGESRGNGRMRLQVETFIREHHMLEPGSRVVAGVSGGADSLCLLDVLCDMRRDWQLEVSAVHVHHGLRGESADRDEAYVRHFCEERQVFCRVYHERVDRLAREQGKSVEEAGRDIRYFRLEQWRRQWGGDCIAVAHHRDDQAETVLFQLVRGSGLKGAGGIRPVNGRVIRPLLCVGRREIERYLAKREISWCEDETNAETDYTRNCIRQQILPLLEGRVNSRAAAHLAAAALEFREAEAYAADAERRLYPAYVESSCGRRTVSEQLLNEAPFMGRRILYRALQETGGSARDLSADHIKILADLLSGSCGRRADLPYGVKAWKEAGRLVLVSRDREKIMQSGDNAGKCIPLTVPGTFFVDGKRFTFRILQGNPVNFPRKKYTKWLDCDRISGSLVLRRRRPGDRIAIDAAGHHKKLKDFLIDCKIPRHQRDMLWLVADDREVLWIIGERMSAACQITGSTRRVLEIEITGDEEDER